MVSHRHVNTNIFFIAVDPKPEALVDPKPDESLATRFLLLANKFRMLCIRAIILHSSKVTFVSCRLTMILNTLLAFAVWNVPDSHYRNECSECYHRVVCLLM